MMKERSSKNRLRKIVFGCLFAIITLFSSVAIPTNLAYADPGEKSKGVPCEDSLGGLGWLVCPETGKIAEATDWLYDKIEKILIINPVEMKDGKPIYEVWKYMRGITNIVFIIFFLVVIYSQLTGLGISNYGIKKALPKLIVTAILVNLSFIICSLAVDVSNIIGEGLRGLLELVEKSAFSNVEITEEAAVSLTSVYDALGDALAIGTIAGAVTFENGAIWMLIPVVLGAVAAVASGLITIAMRQAVVALLIMISPLAMVAYMLPNTEGLFKKWKNLFTKMLVFYPMFSLLFGASSLAGLSIISSTDDGFFVILGLAVQVFPLFFSWSLMKMSGTFLANINSRMHGIMSKPVAMSRAWADSHRQATRQKNLATNNVYTPSLRLMQFLSDRKIAREEGTKEHAELVKNRGLAYAANKNYRKGIPTKEGEEAYDMQARNMEYQRQVMRHKNNMNKGLGGLEGIEANASLAQIARLKKLDIKNVEAADSLAAEASRGAKIEYDNAVGRWDRFEKAKNAHFDLEVLNTHDQKEINEHKFRFTEDELKNGDAIKRYEMIRKTMEGNTLDTNFVFADAAHSLTAQSSIVDGKFKDLFSHTVPTQDLVNMLKELTLNKDSNKYIDPIISGLKVLNNRGDTDLVRQQINNLLDERKEHKLHLGTYASQALANFLMFDVKDNDPFLRRFGKHINLETAKMYNNGADRRTRNDISLYEYVNGEYIDKDSDGNVIYNVDGTMAVRKTKGSAATLLTGTSFKNMERTAIKDMDEAIRECSVDIDENGNKTFNLEKFKKNQKAVWDSIMPNIIGDQFSFLSGSEQIMALGKGITGMDVKKHAFDWKGIFGEEIADILTDDQKKDYMEFMHKRTTQFLGGQVPAQIAKTKSDMLEAVKNEFVFKAAMDEEGSDFLKFAGKTDSKMGSDEYKKLVDKHLGTIRKEFRGAYKEDALKGFVKMYNKGYQGEAKDGLIKMLNPDELYRQYFGNSNNRKRDIDDDDDDDGMPVAIGDDSGVYGTASYSGTRLNIEKMYNESRYSSSDGDAAEAVRSFWESAKAEISSSPSMIGRESEIEYFEKGIDMYTSVGQLYADIMEYFFGGF